MNLGAELSPEPDALQRGRAPGSASSSSSLGNPAETRQAGLDAMREREPLRSMAAKLVWWLEPEAALAQPRRLLAQVMVLGTLDDVQMAQAAFGWDAFRDALEQANPGVFDRRSWAYWHAFFGCPEPALPRRLLP
jgi:hypothetical protein